VQVASLESPEKVILVPEGMLRKLPIDKLPVENHSFCYMILMVLIFGNRLSASTSGPPGDLYVYLDVEDVRGIERDGINLLSTLSISYLDAILGAVVKVI